MIKTVLLSLFFVFVLSAYVNADIVYSLVDHGLANHTMSGTVTVSDSAATDGALDLSEVIRWQVSVEGTDVNFSISDSSPSASINLSGVLITSATIEIPTAANGEPNFFFYDAGQSEYHDGNFRSDPVVNNAEIIYRNSVDLAFDFSSPNANRVHGRLQVAVPEPNGLISMFLVGVVFGCKRHRTNCPALSVARDPTRDD